MTRLMLEWNTQRDLDREGGRAVTMQVRLQEIWRDRREELSVGLGRVEQVRRIQKSLVTMISTSALRALAERVEHGDLGAGEQHRVEVPGHQQDAGEKLLGFWATNLNVEHRRR